MLKFRVEWPASKTGTGGSNLAVLVRRYPVNAIITRCTTYERQQGAVLISELIWFIRKLSSLFKIMLISRSKHTLPTQYFQHLRQQ
jgi:hypothetical protein